MEEAYRRKVGVLRITEVAEGSSSVTLQLEGKIMTEWVSLLERECLRWLRRMQKVILDFSEVTFIDRRGVEMLKRIHSEKLQIINCPALIEDLLRGGGVQWNKVGEGTPSR